MGKRRHWVFSNVFDQIHFILAGNDDMHEIVDEFKIWPDSTKDYRVGCPLAFEKKTHRLITGKTTSAYFLHYF